MNKIVVGVVGFVAGVVASDLLTKGEVRKAASDKLNNKECACRIPESVTVKPED